MKVKKEEIDSLGKSVIVKVLVVALILILGAVIFLFFKGSDILLPETGFVCGSSRVSDFDGNLYNTVQIGNQCWTSENIRAERGVTGDWIVRDCYNDDPLMCETYGGLYDWRGANAVCPEGWYLPSDEDFMELEEFLGMEREDLDFHGWRYSGDVGDKIKLGKESGFDAIMAGYSEPDGTFKVLGNHAFFWTSTSYGDFSWRRYISLYESGIVRNVKERQFGFSVRCTKDWDL